MRVQLRDLPQKISEEVRRQTGDYVIPIVLDQTPRGSGTLVQIDDWLGILTAEHVARHPTKPELRLTWTGHPERFLRTAVGSFAHDLSISTNALRIVTTTRISDPYGPDLAFIALAPSSFLSEVRARKSFYNLTLKTDQRRSDALADLGFFALCGFPAVKDFTGPAELGFNYTKGLYGYAMLTGPERYEKKDEWDYYEMGVSQQSADEFERTFGGVSGGAVWRAFVERVEKDAPGSECLERLTLAGVAFYEFDDRSLARFYVRAHGPLSIYDNLIRLVRQELALPSRNGN
jgi:hypothetical protein